ncbi:hypothetical protein [Streptomyces aurantiacus]|uniref:hypothetical protein n=1 Tax=Streptomyces aurantiacus TaxID=47760 RepID=UPI0006E124C7|nr:hypothetical protein [Streptomyces aurantiacus]
MWRNRYASTGRDGHPPLAVVFNPGTRVGPERLKNRMNTVLQQTRKVWSGTYQGYGPYGADEERDGYYDYADAIPVLFTPWDASRRRARTGWCGDAAATASSKPSPTPWPIRVTTRHGWSGRKHAAAASAQREEQTQAWAAQRERWEEQTTRQRSLTRALTRARAQAV